jgi:ABC-type multidrug transport system ATPase subunit
LEHSYGWLASDGRRVLNGLSFEVTQGATLGLLGPNGAGKTTAIRCITGEEAAFGGTVAIHGDWNACIGLCPQDTVLNMDLSVSENMRFFAMLRRGSRGRDTVDCVERFLGAAGLREKADWLPSALSGGMRRRLSVACAMIGGPSVAILDEPTTGLDPMSRRGIWDAVDGLKAGGGCCLLTTHMMEEAEALCTGVIVLAEGKLAASGSTQQLKEVWGAGYLLKLDVEQGREDGVKVYVESLLPAGTNAPLKTSNEGQMTFTVPPDPKVVGRLFLDLAEGAASHGVLHWGISQCSLEDAYLRVVRSAVNVPAEA